MVVKHKWEIARSRIGYRKKTRVRIFLWKCPACGGEVQSRWLPQPRDLKRDKVLADCRAQMVRDVMNQ